MWGINLWLDWPPLARGYKFHTKYTPTKATSPPPVEQWKIWTSRFRRNNINSSSRQFRFPVWYFKEFIRTILSEDIIRRIEAGKEIWHNKLVEDTANNNFDHVGTLKFINLLLHIDIHLQRVKYIMNEQSMNINVFLLFCSFVFLQIERERGYIKIGYKEKQSQSHLSYLDGLLWRIFLLLLADRLYLIFSTGLTIRLLLVRDFFRHLLLGVLGFWFRPPRTLSIN